MARLTRVVARELCRSADAYRAPAAPAEAACFICHDRGEQPLLRDCVCRGTSGFVHAACLQAYVRVAQDANPAAWLRCATCRHEYGGMTRTVLARARWATARRSDAGSPDHIAALGQLAKAASYTCAPPVVLQMWRFAAACAEACPSAAGSGNRISFHSEVSRWSFIAGEPGQGLAASIACIGVARRLGPPLAVQLVAWESMGNAAASSGNPKGARLLQSVLARRRAAFGDCDADTLATMQSAALALARFGREAEALPLARQALACCQRVYGEGHRQTFAAAMLVGELMCLDGQAAKGLRWLRDTVASAPGAMTLHAADAAEALRSARADACDQRPKRRRVGQVGRG